MKNVFFCLTVFFLCTRLLAEEQVEKPLAETLVSVEPLNFGTPAPLLGISCGCTILHLGKEAVLMGELVAPLVLTQILDLPVEN